MRPDAAKIGVDLALVVEGLEGFEAVLAGNGGEVVWLLGNRLIFVQLLLHKWLVFIIERVLHAFVRLVVWQLAFLLLAVVHV